MRAIDSLTMLAFSALLGVAAPTLADERASPTLNSERIEQRFGSYGIEVLSQADSVRAASLYSLEHDEPVTRTFAVTRLPDSVDAQLDEAHERILAGASIGATLAEAGWKVDRRHLWIGEVPATTGIARLMHIDAPSRLAIHIFDLEISRTSERLRYATIAEIHHPDYLDQDGVIDLFGRVEGASGQQAAAMLELVLGKTLKLDPPER